MIAFGGSLIELSQDRSTFSSFDERICELTKHVTPAIKIPLKIVLFENAAGS